MGTRCEAVLTSTHNLCFGAKIRKIGIPLHTPVLLYKSGVGGGTHFTDMFIHYALFKLKKFSVYCMGKFS